MLDIRTFPNCCPQLLDPALFKEQTSQTPLQLSRAETVPYSKFAYVVPRFSDWSWSVIAEMVYWKRHQFFWEKQSSLWNMEYQQVSRYAGLLHLSHSFLTTQRLCLWLPKRSLYPIIQTERQLVANITSQRRDWTVCTCKSVTCYLKWHLGSIKKRWRMTMHDKGQDSVFIHECSRSVCGQREAHISAWAGRALAWEFPWRHLSLSIGSRPSINLQGKNVVVFGNGVHRSSDCVRHCRTD